MSRDWRCRVCEDNEKPIVAGEQIGWGAARICKECFNAVVQEGGYPPHAKEAEWLRQYHREEL